MSSSHLYLLLSLFTLVWPALGDGCQPKAISLPYTRTKLVTNAEVRGVLWQMGGPNPQNITLMPSAYYIDTYLWSATANWCPTKMNALMCATYRGGLYDRSTSATENDVANLVAHTFDNTIANWTRDDIRLQDNTSLPQYEFGLRTTSTNEFVHKGELGLAKSSTFLKTLLAASKTSSNSYSFFWGDEVSDEPRDGSLTLGGYDQALVAEGSNITVPFGQDDRCDEGIIVTLTGLGLDGGDAWKDLPDLEVCVIATTSNIMTIPSQYWDPIGAMMGVELYPFKNGTSESHLYNTTIVTPASATYGGDMKVTINNDLTVTIPNKQLLFGEQKIETSGLLKADPTIKQVPIVRIRDGDGMMPRLGGMFFSSAVLTVNHDKNQFTISQAQTKSSPSKLVAFDTKNNCVAAVQATSSSSSSGSPKESNGANGDSSSSGNSNSNSDGTSSNSNASESSSQSSALSGGAIAGIVIGVLAGLALIFGAAFVLFRRRRRAGPTHSELAADSSEPVEKYAYHASEMYVDHNGAEMYDQHGAKQYAHEMDGSGRPHEVAAPEYESVVGKNGAVAQGRLA